MLVTIKFKDGSTKKLKINRSSLSDGPQKIPGIDPSEVLKIHATPPTSTKAASIMIGGIIGALGGPPGIIAGGIIGGLLGENQRRKEEAEANEFNTQRL